MRIAYIPAEAKNYQGLKSKSALDRRRLAALIPHWQKQGFELVPWEPGVNCDLVYVVSLTHSLSTAKSLISSKRTSAVVGGIIEDPFYAPYAGHLSDDLWELRNLSQYGVGWKGLLRRARRILGRLYLANDPMLSLFGTIRQCDGIITTSEAQATMIRQLNLHAVGIADCMPASDFGGHTCAYEQRSVVTIVWEGTAWGLQLVELVRPALETLSARAPVAVEFLFVGPRKRPQSLFGMTDNQLILSTRYKLPTRWLDWRLETIGEVLAAADIGIAPMPLHNPFYLNKAFSKPLSYMACGLPVVASPIPSYRMLIRDGVEGLLATTQEEWLEALLRLVASPDLRQQIGLAGKRRLLESHPVETVAERFSEVFVEAVRLHRLQK